MNDAWAIVISATITTVGGLLGILIKLFRSMKNENRNDHAKVMEKLDMVKESVDNVSNRLSDHIDWHLTERTNGSKRKKVRDIAS